MKFFRREWAGHMSVLFLLHQLAENFSANLELLRNVDWVIVPVVNPDGYVYTFTKVASDNLQHVQIFKSLIPGPLLA